MFYERLTELCQSKGTTVTALLKELKLSPSKGTAWKNGAIPKGDKLSVIAEFFGTTVDYLLGTSDDKNKKAGIGEDVGLTDFEKSMLMVKDFSQEDQARVLDYIRLLKMQRDK